jgi:cell division protein FtsB
VVFKLGKMMDSISFRLGLLRSYKMILAFTLLTLTTLTLADEKVNSKRAKLRARIARLEKKLADLEKNDKPQAKVVKPSIAAGDRFTFYSGEG